jgi:hypothetical protein
VPWQGVFAGAIHGDTMHMGDDISILMRLYFMNFWQKEIKNVNVLRVKVENLWIMRGLLQEPILSLQKEYANFHT